MPAQGTVQIGAVSSRNAISATSSGAQSLVSDARNCLEEFYLRAATPSGWLMRTILMAKAAAVACFWVKVRRNDDVIAWRDARETRDPTRSTWRARKERAEAELKGRQLAERDGVLVHRDLVLREWEARLIAAKTIMLARPATLSARVARAGRKGSPKAVRAELEVAVREVIEEQPVSKDRRRPMRGKRR